MGKTSKPHFITTRAQTSRQLIDYSVTLWWEKQWIFLWKFAVLKNTLNIFGFWIKWDIGCGHCGLKTELLSTKQLFCTQSDYKNKLFCFVPVTRVLTSFDVVLTLIFSHVWLICCHTGETTGKCGRWSAPSTDSYGLGLFQTLCSSALNLCGTIKYL